MQANLDALESSQPALMQSAVIINQNNNLTMVAHSASAPEKMTQTSKMEANLAISRKQSIATFIDTTDRNSNLAQAWNVMTPVIDDSKNVIAVVSTSLLTVDAQEVISSAYQKSFIQTFGIVCVRVSMKILCPLHEETEQQIVLILEH